MEKVSASRMLFLIALPLMLGTVRAQSEESPSLEDEQSVLNEIGSSIRPLAYKPEDKEIKVNPYVLKTPRKGIPDSRLENIENLLPNGVLNYAIEINGLKYNARTGKMDEPKRNPYSLAEYLKNGEVIYTDDFLSGTDIECYSKFNEFTDLSMVGGEVDDCFVHKHTADEKAKL